MVLYGARGEWKQEKELALRLLERAAAEAWGLSPLPELARTERGKPFFPGLPDRRFSLSHSGGVVLCALDAAPVGVDVQTLRTPGAALLRRGFSPAERDWLEGQADRAAAFTALWVLKESRAKQSGDGLLLPELPRLAVPLPEGDGPRFLDGLWFGLGRGEDFFWAVCGTSQPPETVCWRDLT